MVKTGRSHSFSSFSLNYKYDVWNCSSHPVITEQQMLGINQETPKMSGLALLKH